MKVFIYLTLVIFSFFSCSTKSSDCSEDENLAEKARTEILESKQNRKQFKLATVANFDWDTLYVLHAYTPAEYFKKETGIEASCIESTIKNDSYQSVIFIKHGKIVSFFNHRKIEGDFSNGKYPYLFTRQNAIFTILGEDEIENPRDSTKNYLIFYAIGQ